MSWLPGTTLIRSGEPEHLEPRQRRGMLVRQPDVAEIAADGDVVRPLGGEVGDDALERIAQMDAPALAHPVETAEPAFEVPIARGEAGDRPEMHVGQVRDGDGFGHGWAID